MSVISTFTVNDHVLRVFWEANLLDPEHGRLHILDDKDIPVLTYRKSVALTDAANIALPKNMDYSWLDARLRFKRYCGDHDLPAAAWQSLAEQSQKAILKRTPWNIEITPGIGVDTHSELMQLLKSMYIGAMLTKSVPTLFHVVLSEPMVANEYLEDFYQFREYPQWSIVLQVEEHGVSVSLDTKNKNFLLRREVSQWGPCAQSLTHILFGFPDDNAYVDWKDMNVDFTFEEYQMHLIMVRDPLRALQLCYHNATPGPALSVDDLFHG